MGHKWTPYGIYLWGLFLNITHTGTQYCYLYNGVYKIINFLQIAHDRHHIDTSTPPHGLELYLFYISYFTFLPQIYKY